MTEPDVPIHHGQMVIGDIVVHGRDRGVVTPSHLEHHILIDWSGHTPPRAGAATWNLNT